MSVDGGKFCFPVMLEQAGSEYMLYEMEIKLYKFKFCKGLEIN